MRDPRRKATLPPAARAAIALRGALLRIAAGMPMSAVAVPRRGRNDMPWYDAAGRFSTLRLAVFLLLLVPAGLVGWRYGAGELGARPIAEALHEIGYWSLVMLLASLAVTPARRLLDWPRVAPLRRMVGVAAFAYAGLHLTLYVADQAFDLAAVAREIVLRVYLTIGFVALLALAALAATSTDGAVRRLGGRRWRRLHRLAYPAALLGVVHFFMQTKADVADPWVFAGLLGWLMGWRAVAWSGGFDGRLARWWPALLAVLAAAGTAAGEAAYFWATVGVDPARILAAQFMAGLGVRPAWVVLAAGGAVALASVLRRAAPALPTAARRRAVSVQPLQG